MIATLEKQAEVDRKRSDSLHQQSQQKIQEKEDEARYWKMRFQNGGSVGTPAAEIKEVVAGPYFCESGSLARLRPQLSALFSEKLGSDKLPNESQWKMILCENPLACINAGAGSGKSTTLVLRIYVMREFLKIPWDEISVFTFTKNSRWDLVDKLIKTFEKLEVPVDQKTASNVIRTFHSCACLLDAKSSANRRKIFELIGKRDAREGQPNLEHDQESSSDFFEGVYDVENPMVEFLESAENDQQVSVYTKLKEIYHIAFGKSGHFRDCLKQLKLASLRASPRNIPPDYRANVDFLEKFDQQMTHLISESFGDLTRFSDVLNITPRRICVDGGNEALFCHFNALIKDANQPILFTPSATLAKTILLKPNYSVEDLVTCKLNILWKKSHIVPIIVTLDELESLAEFLRYFDKDSPATAPPFDFAPEGEYLGAGGGHICKRFFQLIQFVENFGLDFQHWAKNLSLPPDARTDKIFVKACEIYYRYYIEFLSEQGYRSFNHIFLELQPSKLDMVQEKDRKTLRKLTHVLIDEFQDITPLYSGFLQSVKLALAQTSRQAGSIMAVGDDYQSIYGWKGSMVNIITNFGEEFKTYKPPSYIKMERNHRCIQEIIDFAEAIIDRIPPDLRTSKRGISARPDKKAPIPRVFFSQKDNFFEQLVSLIRSELIICEATPEQPLLVLSRFNSTRKEMIKRFPVCDRERMRLMTFHSSKGLEGKSVILIDDCFYNGRNDIKNDVLRQFFKSDADMGEYDRMQKWEAVRLAYVASTRAADRCHWVFVDHPKLSDVREAIERCSVGEKPLCELIRASSTDILEPIPYHSF